MSNTIKHISTMTNDEIYDLIQSYLPIKHAEKSKSGEVFTPPSLINDMFDTLPSTVWQNPHLKWLDPANGIGNFPMIAYIRLMNGLETIIPNKEERSQHIIKNMLYMIELNEHNVYISQQIFGEEANIVCANFLTEKLKWVQHFNDVTTFDIVMGNPPYNAGGIKHKGMKNIYVFFSIQSFSILKDDGYLLTIHPATWRIPHHKIQGTRIDLNKIYTTKQIHTIKLFSIPQTKELMNVMINVDSILIQNTPYSNNNTKTTIIDTNRDITKKHLIPHDFIPNYGLSILDKMKQKSTEHLTFILNSERHAQHNKGGPCKNIHGIKKKGIKISRSKEPHSLLNHKKLIINGIGSYNYVYYDECGEYGLTQSPLAIVEPTINTQQLIHSKLFHYIAGATKIIGNNFNKYTENFLPIIETSNITNSNDLYRFFNFTQREIKKIEKKKIPIFSNNFIYM